MSEKTDICFAGDMSALPFEARAVSVTLKKGVVIDGGEEEGRELFSNTVRFRAEVEEALNVDFLTLRLDMKNYVAWAERVPDEGLEAEVPRLMRKPKGLTRDEGMLFFVLVYLLRERQAKGFKDWLVREDDARAEWEERLKGQGSGRTSQKQLWENAKNSAIKRRWVKPAGEDKEGILRVTNVVAALDAAGFCSSLIEKSEAELRDWVKETEED